MSWCDGCVLIQGSVNWDMKDADQKGLTVKDLEPMIGKSNRMYEILSHIRSLTLKMIWCLHDQLGILAESLTNHPGTMSDTPKSSINCRLTREE